MWRYFRKATVRKMINNWTYQNKHFDTTDIPADVLGFVYLITDLENNKMYVGKKKFWSTVTKPPLKGQKRKRKIKKESDWKTYFGSNKELQEKVKNQKAQNFKREILVLCKSLGELSYYEAKEQFDRNVLLSDQYYNEFIGCKIHSNHVKLLKESFNDS